VLFGVLFEMNVLRPTPLATCLQQQPKYKTVFKISRVFVKVPRPPVATNGLEITVQDNLPGLKEDPLYQ
jgi:hypothetical protein